MRRAIEIAVVLEAELHLVVVVTDTIAEVDDGELVMAIDQGDDIVDAAARIAGQLAPGLTVHRAAVPGVKASEALVRYADTQKAQMLVVGNRGMRGLRRIFGSVSNDVTHSAPCDVLVVKTT